MVGRVIEPDKGEPRVVADIPELQKELDRRLAQKSLWRWVSGSDATMFDDSDATIQWDGLEKVNRGDPGFVEAAIWDGSLGYRVVPEPPDHSNVIVELRAASGMVNTYWHVVVREAEDGGAAVAAEVSVLEGGSVGEYGRKRSAKRKRRLSAKKLSAFWASLEPLAWWRLTDALVGGSTDLAFLDVFLRHESRRVNIKCYGVPPEPQRALVERIEALGGIQKLFAQISKRESAHDP